MQFVISIPKEHRVFYLDNISEMVVDSSKDKPMIYLESLVKKQYLIKFEDKEQFSKCKFGQDMKVILCDSVTVYHKMIKDKVYDKIFGDE